MAPKLTYFDVAGLGEPIRLLLAYGEKSFEDKRVTKEQWEELKPSTRFGQLPMLEIDGKVLTQSVAIARYLGKKYGLAGDNIDDAFQIDQNVDYVSDLRGWASGYWYEQDEEVKAKKHTALIERIYPSFTDKLDQIIKENNGHFAAGKLTWGDFWFAGYYDMLKMIINTVDLDEKYPRFKKLRDTVLSLPKVKEYVESRK